MERMSAAHSWKVRQGLLGEWVWWMYMKESGRDRLVGVPMYGFAPHMQRGMMGGQSEERVENVRPVSACECDGNV